MAAHDEIETVKELWPAIVMDPWGYLTIFALGIGVGLLLMWRHVRLQKAQIDLQNTHIGLQQERLETRPQSDVDFLAEQMNSLLRAQNLNAPEEAEAPSGPVPSDLTLPGLQASGKIETANFTRWASVPRYALWQISWLWLDQEPQPNVTPGTEAYPILQMLKGDIEEGNLQATPSPEGTYNVWAKVGRDELKRYAQTKSDRPNFLFDEDTHDSD